MTERLVAAVLLATLGGAVVLGVFYLMLFPLLPTSLQLCDCGRHPGACAALSLGTLAATWAVTRRAAKPSGADRAVRDYARKG